MLFNTLDYVLFLPVIVILYYLIGAKYRWTLLLAASYYFYMCWKVEYIVLILFSTLVDYGCGIAMEKQTTKKKRRPFLMISLLANLGLLVGFKYFNFFSENLTRVFSKFDISVDLPMVDFLLPVGISFYTFQTLSYSIDVYKGKQQAEKHLGYFALYVSYFPQLVAGPIERFSRLTPQLKKATSLNYDNLANGARLILFGLFAKMVIADNLGLYVDEVYRQPENFSQLSIGTSFIFYSFQIYGDFYGYSMVAIGSARLMGVRLMDNFHTPYLAMNIAEFWQRWHISLSTWFRDYVYFPLGGNRHGKLKWALSILIVFVVSGFWHGAKLTFLFWGLIFAITYLIEKVVHHYVPKGDKEEGLSFKRFAFAIKTFIIVTIAWVFFRSDSIHDAFGMFDFFLNSDGVGALEIKNYVWIFLGLFLLTDILLFNKRFDEWVGNKPMAIRWATYFTLIFSIIVFAGVEDFAFIYFQF